MKLVAVIAVALVWAVGGCDSGSVTIHVQLSTDFVPGRDMGHVSLELDGPDGRRVELETPTGWRGVDDRQTLASFDGLAPGPHRVTVIARSVAPSGMPSDAGAVLSRANRIVTLRNTLVVRMDLSASCVGVTCPDEDPTRSECLAGRCVDPRCDREHAPDLCCVGAACAGIFCETAELCLQPGGDCAGAACEEGLCVWRASPDRCGAGLYCDLAGDACLPLPGGEGADAGLLDEVDAFDGPPDAHVEPPDSALPPADAFEDRPDAALAVPDASGPCAPLGDRCDDGNECTTGDMCTASGCAGTAAPATTRCRATMRSSCRDDRCDGAGRCVFTPINEDTSCDTDSNPCTANECRNGVCRILNVPNGTGCADGDMNLCTVGACSAGACIGLPLPNGTRCTSTAGYICCGAQCVNSRSSEDHCGACNVDCGTRSCAEGRCGCSTDAQCATSFGSSRATCWDSTIAGDPAGANCQCQCPSGSTTCDDGCPNLAHCRMVSGYNECFYP